MINAHESRDIYTWVYFIKRKTSRKKLIYCGHHSVVAQVKVYADAKSSNDCYQTERKNMVKNCKPLRASKSIY